MAFIGRCVTCGKVGLAGWDINELVMEAMRCRGEATPPVPALGPPLPVGAVVAVLDSSGDRLEDGRRMLCSEWGIKRAIEFSADFDDCDKLLLPVSTDALLLRSPFSLELRRNEDLLLAGTADLILPASRSELSSSLLTLPAPAALLGSDRSCGKPLLRCCCCCCPVVVVAVD